MQSIFAAALLLMSLALATPGSMISKENRAASQDTWWSSLLAENFQDFVKTSEEVLILVKDGMTTIGKCTQDEIVKMDYKSLSSELRDWIEAHPYQTAFHVVNGVVSFAPSVVGGLLIWGLGFGSSATRAASAASVYQARIASIPGDSFFACLQSAGARGNGAAAVNMFAQGVSDAAHGMGFGGAKPEEVQCNEGAGEKHESG